jgi:anti-sigma B factor antagonist
MQINKTDNTVILTPEGKLDTLTSPAFSSGLLEELGKNPKTCIVDLSKITFLSSSGLQALLLGAKTAREKHTDYCVCGMNEMVKDVFVMSGFERFIKTFNDLKEAQKAYGLV